MRLYFARHGQSEANVRHIISNHESLLGLTSLGKEQVKALAENLRDVPIGAIYSSPVFRARETADILSTAFDKPYQITEALREYDCGILEDQSDEQSWKLHRQFFEDWTLHQNYLSKPEGGECFEDIRNRFVPFMEDLMCSDLYKEAHILLIGHGGLFLLMLPLVLGNLDHSFTVAQGLHNAEYVLAEKKEKGLICLQWGQVILNTTEGGTGK